MYFHSNITFTQWHGYIVFTYYHVMNFSSIIRCDHKIWNIWRKFYQIHEVLLLRLAFFIQSFSKICFDSVKNMQCYQFLSVSQENISPDIVDLSFIGQVIFSRNFENNWNKNIKICQMFKIILIMKIYS